VNLKYSALTSACHAQQLRLTECVQVWFLQVREQGQSAVVELGRVEAGVGDTR